MLAEVTLQYFKRSGKFYSDGDFTIKYDTPMWRVAEVVREYQQLGTLPGLVPNGGSEFTIYIKADDLKHGYPILLNALE
jgi:hypothetical protein